MTITDRLFELRDETYGDFQSRLTPGIPREHFIGVRVPLARKLAKELYREAETVSFLKILPHKYYDENMLHGLIISEIKDYNECISAVDAFLPYVDNWAVCDIMSPKIFKKHRQELLIKTEEWMKSGETYTVRFGMEMLMTHFLDEDFRPDYLKIPAEIRSSEYYVKMMQAWFFATALAKQWDDAVICLERNLLDEWTHNKTIQKAAESFRITAEQKAYLKTLKKTGSSSGDIRNQSTARGIKNS